MVRSEQPRQNSGFRIQLGQRCPLASPCHHNPTRRGKEFGKESGSRWSRISLGHPPPAYSRILMPEPKNTAPPVLSARHSPPKNILPTLRVRQKTRGRWRKNISRPLPTVGSLCQNRTFSNSDTLTKDTALVRLSAGHSAPQSNSMLRVRKKSQQASKMRLRPPVTESKSQKDQRRRPKIATLCLCS